MFSLVPSVVLGAAFVVGTLAAPTIPAPPSGQGVSAPKPSAISIDALILDNPNDAQLRLIEQVAHGTLPNGPPPPPGSISADGITSLQFVEFNENFERVFFASLVLNITNNVPGFEIKDSEERDLILDALIAVVAVRLPFFCPYDFN